MNLEQSILPTIFKSIFLSGYAEESSVLRIYLKYLIRVMPAEEREK